MQLILYSKKDCHLCDRLEELLRPHLERLAGQTPLSYAKRDIEADAQLRSRYRYRIPVLTCDGREILEGKPTPEQVDRAINHLLQ